MCWMNVCWVEETSGGSSAAQEIAIHASHQSEPQESHSTTITWKNICVSKGHSVNPEPLAAS